MSALAVDNVGHSFGRRVALRNVSFEVAPGTFTILLGRNGAGKTTLISLVTGLYYARQGEIRVFGKPLRSAPLAALAAMGIVFQQSTLDLDLSVQQNLRYQAALHGLSSRDAEERAKSELTRLEVLDRRHDKVRALSGGLRRRVEIARALLHRPKLLLLDEPTVGLDLATRRALLAHVRSLCRERAIAALWATHLMDEVEEADRVVLLHEGAVLRTGSASDLRGQSHTGSIVDAFLALTGEAA